MVLPKVLLTLVVSPAWSDAGTVQISLTLEDVYLNMRPTTHHHAHIDAHAHPHRHGDADRYAHDNADADEHTAIDGHADADVHPHTDADRHAYSVTGRPPGDTDGRADLLGVLGACGERHAAF